MKIQLFLCFTSLFSQSLFAQWEPLPMPPGGDVQQLMTQNNRVWTYCSNRNYLSDDQGLSWQHWTLPDSLEARRLWVSDSLLLAISNRKFSNISDDSEEIIFKSKDNGDTWQAVFYDTLHQYDIQAVFGAGEYLFLLHNNGLYGNFLYRSADNGASWQKMNVGGNGTGDILLSVITAVAGSLLIAKMYLNDDIGSPITYSIGSTAKTLFGRQSRYRHCLSLI